MRKLLLSITILASMTTTPMAIWAQDNVKANKEVVDKTKTEQEKAKAKADKLAKAQEEKNLKAKQAADAEASLVDEFSTPYQSTAIEKQQSKIAQMQAKLERLQQEEKDKYAESDPNAGPKDYRNVLFLKLNKNQGYRHKQAFEDQKRYALLEKGVSYASFNINFQGTDVKNLWVEPIAIVDNVYNRNFGTQISAGYFIRNNMAIGAKFSYKFSDVRLKVNADILDIIINAKTYETNNASTTFSGSFLVKNYIPIDRAHRLFIVTETNIGYAKTNSISKNYYAEGVKVHKVETNKDSFFLGLSPGFMYFMTRGFAFEFAMNPVVAYYTKTSKVNNDVADGSVSSYGLSFKFMPFNIQFGFSYYFGLNYNKNREYVNSLKNSRY